MLLIRPHATLLRIEAEHRGLDIGSDDEVLPNQRLDMARVRDCVCLCVPVCASWVSCLSARQLRA